MTSELTKQDVKLKIALDQFVLRMDLKLAGKAADGRSGWNDPDWDIENIKALLIEHVEKGDFIDVANFALFAWHNQLDGHKLMPTKGN